jgi:hypothetical protein
VLIRCWGRYTQEDLTLTRLQGGAEQRKSQSEVTKARGRDAVPLDSHLQSSTVRGTEGATLRAEPAGNANICRTNISSGRH